MTDDTITESVARDMYADEWRDSADGPTFESVRDYYTDNASFVIRRFLLHSGESADARRLDCLEAMANTSNGILLHDGGQFGRDGLGLRPGNMKRTLREAIDAAMQSEVTK